MTESTVPVAAIVGGGFCGLMTAMNLIEKATRPLHIFLINDDFPVARGVAFSAHTSVYLLNVPASTMSCFADDLRHFLRWLQQKEDYKTVPENLLERMFVPRRLYGEYLHETWQEMKGSNPQVTVQEIKDKVVDAVPEGHCFNLYCKQHAAIKADYIVVATGNEKPASIRIPNITFYQSVNYHANPWKADAVKVSDNKAVLIIGNGLTMVDTVLGLLEQNYQGTIYSLSPNGFALLPHISNGVLYKEMLNELSPPYNLGDLFSMFKKHIRAVGKMGLTAEPVIDSVRVKTQEIWSALSLDEKKRFLRHLRYHWNIARHRIPAHIHRRLQQLRINQKLVCYKANLLNIEENNTGIQVGFYNKDTGKNEEIEVASVINCTGPVCDITRSDNELIKNLVNRKLIVPDPLRLGINAGFAGAIIDGDGNVSKQLFTLGSHMKGILWESTAVPDLRVQAERLAIELLRQINATESTDDVIKILPQRIKTKVIQAVKEEELIEYYI